jgi:chromosome condensin MukBEF MukE localization factor
MGGKDAMPDKPASYSAAAVTAAIASSNRAGRKIGSKETKLIHALLRGRDGRNMEGN